VDAGDVQVERDRQGGAAVDAAVALVTRRGRVPGEQRVDQAIDRPGTEIKEY